MMLGSFIKTATTALVVCFGVVPFAMGACTGPAPLEFQIRHQPNAATYEELGRWFGDQHQYSCAVEAYRSGLALNPNSASLSYLLGLTLYVNGDAQGAIAPLRQSLQSTATAKQAHLLLAAAFQQLQSRDNAKAEFVEVLRLDPRSTPALEGLSKLLLADGNYGAVISILRSAPLNEILSLNLAQSYGKVRMLDQAAQVLTSALRTNPSSFRLTSTLANVRVSQAHNQEALDLMEKFVRAHPSVEAQGMYLELLVLDHHLDPARVLAKKLLAAHPHDFQTLYMSGVLERTDGKYSEARPHLQEAVALNPNHFNARYNLGIVLSELNDPAGAKTQLEKALTLGPGSSESQVRYRLSRVLRALGEKEEANEQSNLAQKKMQTAEDNTLAFAKSEEAAAALKAGDPQRAVALYREAVDATPNDALLNFKFASALERAGDTQTEQTVLEKIITIDPTFAAAHYQIGYLASQNGDFTAAEQHFRQAVHAAPGYAEAWLSLAATLATESRFPEALDAVNTAIRLAPKNDQALQLRQELKHSQSKH